MRVSIFGTGYVGLVTGTCLSEVGNDVTCVDIDAKKIKMLADGIIPIYEPSLEAMVKNNVAQKRLTFTTDSVSAIKNAQVIMIAVGTPPGEDGSADLKYVLEVAKTIGSHMDNYKVIVTKSTVPVGTSDKVKDTISQVLAQRGQNIGFAVTSNPEFLKEGTAVSDFMKPDRIVIGSNDPKATKILTDLYGHFVKNGFQVFTMDVRSSELTKYASNAMLATKISFMNELSRISEAVGADIKNVRLGMGADQRIGYQFTHPGVGYGGSCFPKDVQALIRTADSLKISAPLLKAVEEVNKTQRERFISKITNFYKDDLKGKRFAIWGLSFKPDTDDIREAPAIDIISQLIKSGASCIGYDPVAMKNVKEHFKSETKFTTVDSPYEALTDADAMILCTEWKPFRSPDFERMKSLMKAPVIFDGRNQYEPENLKELGFHYTCIGRQAV
jgi:UDPglucose 6-dehydrogenase